MPDQPELQPDDLVTDLVSDPSQVPDLIVLTGFLGESSRQEYWRLYLTADMSEYLEFRKVDVRHYRRLTAQESSLGGTLIWLDRDVTVRRTSSAARQAQAEFLRGDLIANYQARMADSPVAMGVEGLIGAASRSAAATMCGVTCASALRPICSRGSIMHCESFGPCLLWLLGTPQIRW